MSEAEKGGTHDADVSGTEHNILEAPYNQYAVYGRGFDSVRFI